MGLNFQYNDGLQPKIRAGIINEHECSQILIIAQTSKALDLLLKQSPLGIVVFYT